MALMIAFGNELIRVSPKNTIEYSTNSGRTWNIRFSGTNAGRFMDLLSYGNEIVACTSRGIFYSTNAGRTWNARYTGSSYGEFVQLTNDGSNILATTSRGLFYSTNAGRTWNKR